MAIETTTSPLASALGGPIASMPDVAMDAFAPLDSQDHVDEANAREVAARPDFSTRLEALVAWVDDINIARYMTDTDLDSIGVTCVDEYRIDEQSRKDWEDQAETAMRFAMQKTRPKQTPWPGASSFIWPLITQAATEFHARTYGAIIPDKNLVKGVIWGDDRGTPVTMNGQPDGPPRKGADGEPLWLVPPGAKRQRADRIGEHMSYQLLEEFPEWEPQTDQMLLQMPVVGGFGRKTFRDPVENRNSSLAVSLFNLVWNYNAKCFEKAPRVSEKIILYPNEIIDLERTRDEDDDEDVPGGMFLTLNYGPGGSGEGETYDGRPLSENTTDGSAPHMFIEQHRWIDLDQDGYPEPYVVTVHLRSQKVVRIVARYDKDGITASKDGQKIRKIKAVEFYTLYRFLPSIDGGSYPMGFGHLLRALNEGINSSINQMFDAGTLANTGGGFMSDSIGLPSGQTLFGTGKFHRVTNKGGSIRDAIYPMDFKGPSQVLFSLMGTLISASEKLASIGSILTGDAAIANAPPTTVLALIQQGMNFYTGVVKRIFLSEKAELNKLHALNKKWIVEETQYMRGDEVRIILPDDYRNSAGVEPVADPTMTTDMQRLGRAQVLMSTKDEPGINRLEILRRFYEAANIDRVDDLISPPDPQAAQLAQAAAELQMALGQAQLGVERAKELKDQTQAFLNMALARKNANAQEEAFINAQLDFLRLHIEALNTQTKAAAVDHKFHDTNMNATQAAAQRAAAEAEAERQRAHDMNMAAMQPAPGMPTPGPTGAFPTPPDAPAGPDVTGAASPNTGTTAVPGMGPSGPGNPAPDAGAA